MGSTSSSPTLAELRSLAAKHGLTPRQAMIYGAIVEASADSADGVSRLSKGEIGDRALVATSTV